MATFDQRQQMVGTQYNAAGNMYIYAQATPRPVDPETFAVAERQLATLPLELIPDPALLPLGSRMPLRRNPLFVGRAADLCTLATALKDGKTAAASQTAAIIGLGGMGKTQLASEFVHRYGQFFAGGVFWLSFADPAAVPTEIAACGGPGALALHPEFHNLPLADQVQLVQADWQSPLPRLLIFDNCEDETLLAQWRPSHGGCRVLVTSRRARWEPSLGVQLVPLGILQREESLALLRHHRPDLSVDNADLNPIAAELGDLPLALHLSGSFLARYRQAVTPAIYLTQLRQLNLLAHQSLQGVAFTRELSPTQHEPHVARTFALSYDRLDPANSTDVSALALLARAVHFAPGQPIPRDLLFTTIKGTEDTPEVAMQAEDALGRLLDLGLLEPNAAGAVRLHRLLAVFVQAVAHDVRAQAAVEDVLLAETKRLCDAGYPGPLLPLYPHLRAVTEAAQRREDARTADLATVLGDSLYLLGDYAGAQPSYERALAIREQAMGSQHPLVTTSLNNLATLYNTQGRYAAAEPLYQRALAIRERGLGPDHPEVAQSLNNLAELYHAQGRYAAAEPLHQRALAIREQALGPDHPDTAESLHNLAVVYDSQGRYAAAEPLHQRALAIWEQALGPQHPLVAASLHGLAVGYHSQVRRWWFTRGKGLWFWVGVGLLVGGVQVGLGLGLFYGLIALLAQGGAALLYKRFVRHRYAKAEPLFQRALAIWEQTLGPQHPQVAYGLQGLAVVYHSQGRYAAAEPLYRRAMAICEQALGPQHPQVAHGLYGLARAYLAQGRYAAAEPLYRRAMAIWEQALGPQHPEVAMARKNYAGSRPLRQRIRSWLLCK